MKDWQPTSTIYRITCTITGQMYVGATEDFKGRMRTHKRKLRQGYHHNTPMQCAYNQYGIDAFTFEVIEVVSRKLADEREIYWISFYDSVWSGFNMTPGGNKKLSWPQRKYKSETQSAPESAGVNRGDDLKGL